ncbi:MAG: DUF4330 family protein [Clostridia bacterium]|nr:DUF4330 family protein [Clostridia bacterium]
MAKDTNKPKYEKGVKGKSGKNHIVDVLLILLLIVGIGLGVYFGLQSRKEANASRQSIHYVLLFENVDSVYKNAIAANQDLYLTGDSLNMGRILRVESIENYAEPVYDEATGGAVLQKYPENTRVNITVVVEAEVDNRSEGYYMDDVRIAIGTGFNLSTATYSGVATCIGFSD